ncbi:MAG: hypothetical protein ACI4LA_08160 [Emergencia sp.]
MKKKMICLIALLLLAVLIPAEAAALTSPKDLVSYSVTLETSGRGQLYWNYGKNMEFFAAAGPENLSSACLASKGSWRFTSLIDRGLVVYPDEGWYFDGFFDQNGRRVSLTENRLDIIRITKNGIYYYDCVPSYEDSRYACITSYSYRKLTAAAVKALYGTSSYKVMETVTLYRVPKQNQKLYPRFLQKQLPAFSYEETLCKTVSDKDFFAVASLPDSFAGTFRASSSKLLSIDSKTGLCSIRGEGIAVVSVTIPATEKTLQGIFSIRVRISPDKVTLKKSSRTADTSVYASWKADGLCSGYEIQVAADKAFSKITAKKTVSSGKTSSTKIRVPKTGVCRYLRIRPFKKSRGETLYGKWTSIVVE